MKFIIFDIDGTLADTKKVEDKCFMQAFEQTFHLDITNQKWEGFKNVTDWGITEDIILKEYNRKPTITEYEAMISNFTNLLQKEKRRDRSQFKEINGAKSFFDKLIKIDEFKLGIATGSWEASAKIKLEAIGISLEGICFSNSDYHKTREAITKDVISQLKKKTKESPEEIIYFGDGAWDFITCKNIGIRFIGIDNEKNGKLKALGANTIFKDFMNHKQIITELKQTK